MEFVEGESLGQRLEREKRLEPAEALRIVGHVAQALHRAHKLGMIHRDVKPDNILLTPDGQVKLADLGLVKSEWEDQNLTRTGRGLGTPHFMAPEQFRNAKNAGVRCDIYSLAATLYVMLTGELPFQANGPLDVWMKKINNELIPPQQLAPGLSERVDWAIRRAMSQEPAQRPASCREFVEDLTGHSTRKLTPIAGETMGMWYLVYRDEKGIGHTVKGTLDGIRRSLKEKLYGDARGVRASRSKSGPFEPLRAYPELRDLVVEPGVPATATGAVSNSASGAAADPATSAAAEGDAATGASTPLPPTEQEPDPFPTPVPDSTTECFAGLLAKTLSEPSAPRYEHRARARTAPHTAPHINMGRVVAPKGDWLKWASLIFIAAGSGLAGYLLMRCF
jgi:serine/threonine protein kinase